MSEISTIMRNIREGMNNLVNIAEEIDDVRKREPGNFFKVFSYFIEPIDSEVKMKWERKKQLPALRQRLEAEFNRVVGQMYGHKDMFYEAMYLQYGTPTAKRIWNEFCDAVNELPKPNNNPNAVKQYINVIDGFLEHIENAV